MEGLQEQTQSSGEVSQLGERLPGEGVVPRMNTGKIRSRQWKFVQQVVRSETETMWDLSLLGASGFCVGMGTASVELANSRPDFLRRKRNGTCCPGWDQLLTC